LQISRRKWRKGEDNEEIDKDKAMIKKVRERM
jgi:hypothetical protein